MKKTIVFCLFAFLLLIVDYGQVFAFDSDYDLAYYGTVYEASIINEEYTNDVQLFIESYSFDVDTLEVIVSIYEDNLIVKSKLDGSIHYNVKDEIIFFDLSSDNNQVSVMSFYIDLFATKDFLHSSHTYMIDQNVVRMVFSYNDNVYFFENISCGVFSQIINNRQNYIERNNEILYVLSYMPFWYYEFSNSVYDPQPSFGDGVLNIQPFLAVGNLDELDNAGGVIPPSNGIKIGDNVPFYVYEKHQNFSTIGSGFYTYDNYVIYRKTVYSYANTLTTSIIVLKTTKTIPPDSRYDSGTEVGYALELIAQGSYIYNPSDNSLEISLLIYYFYADQISITLSATDDDVAWADEHFIGTSQYEDSGFDSLVKLGVYAIPYVGSLLEYYNKKNEADYSSFYIFHTYLSQFYSQVSAGEIYKEILGEAGDFRLFYTGDTIKLFGDTTYKDFLSVSGYKYILVKVKFDINVYRKIASDDFEATYTNYTQITYYR